MGILTIAVKNFFPTVNILDSSNYQCVPNETENEHLSFKFLCNVEMAWLRLIKLFMPIILFSIIEHLSSLISKKEMV